MRGWRVHEITEDGAMVFGDCPDPRATGDGCVVKVAAAGVNFLDTLMIRGRYQVKPPLPFTPGIEVAGTVVEAGPDSRFRPGDRLCALMDHGGFADHAAVPALGAQKLPDDFPLREAVALPVIYPTAHLALRHRAGLKAGETVLVHAGAGGVGSAAIQLARHWGARVIATAGGPQKTALCRDLGADEIIDYAAEPLVERVKEITHGRGVDVIVDPVGGKVAVDSLRCLAWGGRLVIVGFAGGAVADLPSNRLLLKNAAAMGVYWGAYRQHRPELVGVLFDELFALRRTGAIVPLIRDVFPLAQAPAALEALAGRRTVGKVVLEP
ncbi:NADPH:quinone oxidoreductase family protein [Xanthobacter autotrophicus]|uniref:NADPH:quinone oxidoreductase family protein n=1 Tax=Xanthobacter autotrophicus TaxID=280 RepID=UPI0024A6CD59|nr:NADPH:quinone oxidoreductase family protein [Xanthobacter autotrophicus]MDI4655434.1 NADPH:quinone oxidoreductase family protein [Xanthobacter autotrophicus]